MVPTATQPQETKPSPDSEVVIPCQVDRFFYHGWNDWWGFLRVELADGQQMGNNYGLAVGLVDPKYKNTFEVAELAPGITATAYSIFLDDPGHEVFSGYPIADVTCGKSNFVAYQKLYSVFGDDFDFAAVMPGLQIFRPDGFGENVPYNVIVKNEVQHIGMGILDNAAQFGSAGRLKECDLPIICHHRHLRPRNCAYLGSGHRPIAGTAQPSLYLGCRSGPLE